MSRRFLAISAAILTTLIIAVGINGLDHLPAGMRAQIDSERAALVSIQNALARPLPADGAALWAPQISQAKTALESAARDMDALTGLEKSGHHGDEQRAQTLLAEERGLRMSAQDRVTAAQDEAARWTDGKEHLPQLARQMEQDYQAIHAFDLQPVTAAVKRAEGDWPQKNADLEARLGGVTSVVAQSDSLWQATAAARRQAAAGDANLDYAALFTAADQLHNSARALSQKAAEVQSLTAQLYDSWDKILVDQEVRGSGSKRAWDQKIRTVRVHDGQTTSDERWVGVPQPTYEAMRNDLGMDIEHKPAGKFDSEAEHTAQPPGYAYIAPPSQGSNQYGHWEHRDGQSFWVFYGQYALMRDLLFNHSYRPLPPGEWEQYRDYRSRGQTYYGRDAETGAPKYGTEAQNRRFRNSPYASKPGGYRDSPYASKEAEPKTFGRNARPSELHVAPAPRPAPRPSFRPPPSGGRRFGGRRR